MFEILNIDYWATDGGASLHTQEDGCGDLTGWDWTAVTSSEDAYAHFNIDFFIQAGCIERATDLVLRPRHRKTDLGVGGEGRRRRLGDRSNVLGRGEVTMHLADSVVWWE